MAIVTISEIQHRRGILGSDPMPQLASAEFGWAIDKQELYIGNGTIAEGAPYEGNTQILTEHSNLVALLSDYTYSGPFSGAAMQTGADVATPITRTFIERYDDYVSVRAFGAVGDGVTNDYDALQRAINQHTLNQLLNNRYWTTIYVPAGTYVINTPLSIPPHVRLVGDGSGSTIIELSTPDSEVLSIIQTQDPDSGSDVYPEDIKIEGITFRATQNASHVCVIGNARDVIFDDVSFEGSQTDTTTNLVNTAAVLFANTLRSTTNIVFNNCKYKNMSYGVTTDIFDGGVSRQDISNITIRNGIFYNLYTGVLLGNEINPAFDYPTNIRVLHSSFDKVTKEGIHLYRTTKFTSYANYFGDVGNDQGSAPTSPCVVFGDYGPGNPLDTAIDLSQYENNYSIGDHFERTDAQNDIFPRIQTNCLKSYVLHHDEVSFGTHHLEMGRMLLLADGQTTATSTGIALSPTKYQGAIIDYQLNRGDDQKRTGTMYVTLGSTTVDFSETYDEIQPTGIDFSIAFVGGEAVIEYTSTAELKTCVMSYAIRHVTCTAAQPTTVAAPPPTILGIPNDGVVAASTPGVPPATVADPVVFVYAEPGNLYSTGSAYPFSDYSWIEASVSGVYDTLLWEIINWSNDVNNINNPGAPSMVSFTDPTILNTALERSAALPDPQLYLEVRLTATNTTTGQTHSDTMILGIY